jgi:IPT/TIG domain-containing protein
LRQARTTGDFENGLHVEPGPAQASRLRRALRNRRLVTFVVLLAACAGLLSLGGSGRAQSGDTITIVAVDAKTGDEITHFKWMVNLDTAHENASVNNAQTYSPVVATGDDSNPSVSLLPTAGIDRGYLVTVLANDGVGSQNDPDYKLAGTHFRMPEAANGDGKVYVRLEPNPLPLATLKVLAFRDNAPVNSAEDIPLEKGLADFHVTISDPLGEVVTDWFGNPLCTKYEDLNHNGKFDLPGDEGADGPVPLPGTAFCVTGSDGYVSIPNLGPNRYEVEAIPPNGSGWIQSTTIEGSPAIDAWVHEGTQGFGLENNLLPSPVWFGFVKACQFGNVADDCESDTADTLGAGTITGRIRASVLDTDAPGDVALGAAVSRPYLALSNLSGDDEQVFTGRGNPDGTFTISNVPAGLYQMAVWDKPLDYIIQFFTVNVPAGGGTVALGDLGVPRWWGTIKGSVFIDKNQNGVRDPGESGLARQDLDTRFKDGTIQYATLSDSQGNYEFPEVFELEHFAIAEVGYGRFKNTGAAAYATDDLGNPLNYPWTNDCTDIDGNAVTPCALGSDVRECTNPDDWRTCEHGPINQDLGLAGLLQAEITWAGLFTYIDWGKAPFKTDPAGTPVENGGIVGIAFNDVTRNELDARLQAPEDYEPGIPGTEFRLWAPKLDANGEAMYDPATGEVVKDHLANVYNADGFYDARPADCIPKGSIGRDPSQVQPYPGIWNNCLELPAVLNQTRPGVFDGGYAFEEDCSNPDATDPTDPTQLLSADAGECVTLPAGKWVVEVVPPAGYKITKEEDVNVFSGDVFTPAVPPPPCAGQMHTVHVVDDPAQANFDPSDPVNTSGVYNPDFLATTGPQSPSGGSPFEGDQMPICNERLITLQNGFNANSDFFMFTDVPPPGKIRGLLLDDLNVELDPNSPMYGEKRGIPNAPVGVLDFAGNEVARTMSDANGYWEVTLPSTGTYNCPLPAGPCPAVYQFVGNYPGTPDNPTEPNPNYSPLVLDFEVWPGLTTIADVATLPITSFVSMPGTQFQQPPVCNVAGDTPDVRRISQPYGRATDADSFTIHGTGFGGSQGSGQVALDGTALDVSSWSGTSISVPMTALGAVSPGPHQLLVTADNGNVSATGITFHVLGTGYEPNMLHVGPGQTYGTIQAALDAAGDGDLVLVHPGSYEENLIVDEKLKLQGYGPGATTIDGHFFNFKGISSAAFGAKIASLAYDGPVTVPQGQAITVIAEKGEFTSADRAQIDGFTITSGTGVERTGIAAKQGGAIYAHAYAKHLRISNNVVQGSAGIYGGGIILGQPYVDNPDVAAGANPRDSENDFVSIDHNRILNNGGVLLAGGVALFNGANDYTIEKNIICGNYSAEYGGGVSNFGKSSGVIRANEILFNYAFDEGGGIMVAGEEPTNASQVSAGTGDIAIERNRIEGNVSNDDGGGMRLLAPVAGHISIVNNIVVANIGTDTGGGIDLDDALHVDIVNNTIADNVSTATAEDADRSSCSPPVNATCPHGAGIVSEGHSAALLKAIDEENYDCSAVNCGSDFSDPVLFNNVIRNNEAFYLDGTTGLTGGGLHSAGDLDLEVRVAGRHFDTKWSDCTAFTPNCQNDGTNTTANPLLVNPVSPQFDTLAFAGDPSFITVLIKWGPGSALGNFHVELTSPVIDGGTDTFAGVSAPATDFDGEARPIGDLFDMGADERPGASPSNVSLPALTGTFEVGATIHVVHGAWNGAAPALADQLQRCDSAGDNCVDIAGATGPDYLVTNDDLNHRLRVLETASNPFGSASATSDASAVITAAPPPPTVAWYLSLGQNGTAGGVAFRDEDILSFDGANFAMFFDGSDVGVGSRNVDAFALLDADSLLMSFNEPLKIAGLGTVDDSDIVRFDATSLGATTAGTFSPYFDGSDVGLTEGSEDVDAVERKANGKLLISTTGNVTANGRTGRREDLLRFNPTSLGANTSGTWSMYFDGSDVGLTTEKENIDGTALAGGKVFLSTTGSFAVPGRSGANEDIFKCTPTSLGWTTACSWSSTLAFNGSAYGLGPYNVDAIEKG